MLFERKFATGDSTTTTMFPGCHVSLCMGGNIGEFEIGSTPEPIKGGVWWISPIAAAMGFTTFDKKGKTVSILLLFESSSLSLNKNNYAGIEDRCIAQKSGAVESQLLQSCLYWCIFDSCLYLKPFWKLHLQIPVN